MGMPDDFEYSSAFLIIRLFITGLPSSEKATHPAERSTSKSTSSLPSCPFVTAPIGKTLHESASLALLRIYDVTSALSFTGFVFGMQQTAVKPPRTAAS